MMTADLVSMYLKGAITADHLVVECLNRVDPENPGLVLNSLPDDILGRMLELAREYRPQGVVRNYGPLPTEAQVVAAKAWIEAMRNLGDPLSLDRADVRG